LGSFFSGDDWFHLRVSNVDSWQEFLNFFSFVSNPQSISFYRPLSTQVFFWVFYKLFGLNPVPYYLAVFATFGFSLRLVYRVALEIGKIGQIGMIREIEKFALLVVFFYGFSVTNFTKLYFLSTFQELLMVVFVLLAVLSYLNRRILVSVVMFILALMSKETAVVLPFLLVLIEVIRIRQIGRIREMERIEEIWINNWKRWLPFWVVVLGYLYLRLLVFSVPDGDSYIWDFSVIKAANTAKPCRRRVNSAAGTRRDALCLTG